MSCGLRSSCYWTDWNRANTENIRIGLVFAVLAQWKFWYCIDRFDHIKSNKSKLINKCLERNSNRDHSPNFFRHMSLLFHKWLPERFNLVDAWIVYVRYKDTPISYYKCSFSMPLWCCVAGCINWEYWHIFPKDPALKNWNGRDIIFRDLIREDFNILVRSQIFITS
jgi:hypothetical protein